MCRNIRPLHNYEPASTEQDAHDAALQYVRKVSGMTKPARVNEEAFQRAVEAVTEATSRLLGELVATAPARSSAPANGRSPASASARRPSRRRAQPAHRPARGSSPR